MALSKNYTLNSVESIVRVLVDEIAPDKVVPLTIKDYVNLSVADVAEMLNGAAQPDYGSIVSGSVVSNQFSLVNTNFDKVVKVVDSNNGLVPMKSDFAFENLAAITSYQNSVFYFQHGETLNFFKGNNVSNFGTASVYYYRQPVAVVSSSDFLDIRDKYVPLVIAKVKNFVYEQVGKEAPEALTNLIESKTTEIRQLNMDENALIRNKQRGDSSKQ